MITPKLNSNDLDTLVAELVGPLGFRPKRSLSYMKRCNDAIAILSWSCRVDPRGYIAFSSGVGLHFQALHALLRSEEDDPVRVTVCTGVYALRGESSFSKWKASTKSELAAQRAILLHDMTRYSLPFIAQYSDYTEFRRAVFAPTAEEQRCFSLSVDMRVTVQAAIQWIDGDRAAAIRTLDVALIERKGTLPKRWWDIKELRSRLIAELHRTGEGTDAPTS